MRAAATPQVDGRTYKDYVSLWGISYHVDRSLLKQGADELDIVLGVVGAIVGGWLFTRFGAAGVTGLNLYSILVAVVGSVVVLVVYHAIRRAA